MHSIGLSERENMAPVGELAEIAGHGSHALRGARVVRKWIRGRLPIA